MKIVGFCVLLLLGSIGFCAHAQGVSVGPSTDGLAVRIMSFNIRYYRAPNDGLDAWEYRRRMVADIIQDSGADVIGLQEAEFPQVEYLRGKLEDDYGFVVVYSNGKHSNALLYRKSRFEVEQHETFWFSDMPDTPDSKGWGNQSPRFCTWAHFVDKETKQGFYYFNTHLDHLSEISRDKASVLITERIVGRASEDPFVITGDFNSREDSAAVLYFKGRDVLEVEGVVYQNPIPLVDVFRVRHGESGPAGTYNYFDSSRVPLKIDYILTEPEAEIMGSAIITDEKNGHYPSDHFPITADILFR